MSSERGCLSMAAKMSTEFVNVPGGFISLSKLGDIEKTVPVLYIHGGPGGNCSSFMPMAEKLAENRIVYFYNQIGSDEAAHMDEEHQWQPQCYVETLSLVIKTINSQRLHVIGRSWGAYLAAEHLLADPNSPIISITMTSPFLSTELWIKDSLARLEEMGEDALNIVHECENGTCFDSSRYQEIITKFNNNFQCRNDQISRLGNANFTKAVRSKSTEGMKVYRRMWGPSEFSCTGILKDMDITPRLPQIKVPVLFIIGEFDQVSSKSCEYYRSLIPGSRMAVIPHASQTAFLENFDIFYWTFCNFIINVE